MSRAASLAPKTYLTDTADAATVLDFVRKLEAAGRTVAHVDPALVIDGSTRIPLTAAMVDVLRHVADALSAGMGVTVAPHNARLTTQEAAEFLGISRPTLVRLLDHDEIPMEKPGRHRYVRLSDLVAYQERMRTRRREVLDQMVREAEEDGLYAATDGPPPKTR